jgi:hypothetical protein
MTKFNRLSALLPLLAVFCFGSGFGKGKTTPAPQPTGNPPAFSMPSFKKVFIVILENTSDTDAKKQPFLAQLAREGAYLSNYYSIAHPSQPNYFAYIGGDTFGKLDDKNHDIDATTIADTLEAKGYTWKMYADGYPGNCYTGAFSGAYARKHVPFISFKNISGNPARCGNIVNSSELAKDVANGTLADYSFFAPDQKNDGHDTGVAYADKYMKATFGPLLQNPAFMKDMLFITTFDENDGGNPNRIYLSMVGDSVKPGVTVDYPFTIYSLLRVVEETFRLDSLHRNDEKALPISGVWK